MALLTRTCSAPSPPSTIPVLPLADALVQAVTARRDGIRAGDVNSDGKTIDSHIADQNIVQFVVNH
ncbi:MAG: hypothetical protein GY854_33465 [Deltaproteobacteria bacterium]|nr:hypothetical protein [Deltaproteobacteria bacterium]